MTTFWTGIAASSASDDWSTPLDFFLTLDREFGFVLDPCASPTNAKCDRFFTVDDDGLGQDWAPGPVFMNPPYGESIERWVAKAWAEARRGVLVVGLVPSRTDTEWWHRYCIGEEVRFVKGRLRFGGSPKDAPFASAVIVWRPR